ncbi:MAG: hypothetical protein ACKO23_01585 [Gemmataceae bacterium]
MENKLHPFHQIVAKTIAESREAILRHRLYDSLQTEKPSRRENQPRV